MENVDDHTLIEPYLTMCTITCGILSTTIPYLFGKGMQQVRCKSYSLIYHPQCSLIF